ncbi:MAG: hypothetical protein ACI8RZ_000836 [Myxococcota bacterium]|jgi:hypothetical protein
MLSMILAMMATAEAGEIVLVDDGPHEMSDKREYRNQIVGGVGVFPMTAKGRFQHLVTDNVSLMVGGSYGRSLLTISDSSGGLERVSTLIGADYHPMGNGLHGLYIGPRAKWSCYTVGLNEEPLYQSGKLSVQGIIGYRAVFDPGLTLAVGVGLRYIDSVSQIGDPSEDLRWQRTGLGGAAELNVGWAF